MLDGFLVRVVLLDEGVDGSVELGYARVGVVVVGVLCGGIGGFGVVDSIALGFGVFVIG